MDFYQIITLLFSFLGLMNGLFAAGLFRLKRFYLYGIAGALISCGAVQYSTTCGMRLPIRSMDGRHTSARTLPAR